MHSTDNFLPVNPRGGVCNACALSFLKHPKARLELTDCGITPSANPDTAFSPILA